MTHKLYGDFLVYGNTTLSGNTTIVGGTLAGALILNADPTLALQAATKQYVDSKSSSGGGGTSISTTAPLYVGCGASTTVSGTAIVSVYEQIADQTFNATYNTRTDYTEENNTTGTDWSNGSFTLHGTGNPDSNTKLLCHFDNGLVDDSHNSVVINGGPFSNSVYKFGSSSAYFNGSTSYLTGPTGNAAFKFSADFTVECWVYPFDYGQNGGNGRFILDTSASSSTNGIRIFLYNNNTSPANPNLWVNIYGSNLIMPGGGLINMNSWSHIAVVRSGSTITAYTNGINVGSTTLSTNFSDGFGNIGQSTSNTGRFYGYIDEFRISNNARYTSNFTPSTSAFSNDANTNLLLHFDGNLIDSSSNNLSISPNGMVTLSPKIGSSSCYFNGSSYLRGPVGNAAFKFSGDFTMEGWFYTISNSSSPAYFDTTANSSGGGILLFNATGTLTIWHSGIQPSTSFTVTNNVWHHFAVTRSGSTLQVWANGNSVYSGTYSTNFSDGRLLIGYHDSWIPGNYLTGYVDEFRISQIARYTTTFTPSTAPFINDGSTSLLLHFDGNINDSSNNNLTLINTNAVLQGPCQFGQASAYFNGSSYLTIADSAIPALGSNNFVIEAWIYTTSLSNHNQIFNKNNGGNYEGFSLMVLNTGSLYFVMTTNGTSWVTAQTATSTITTNTWYHVVGVRSGTSTYVYVNGTRGATVGTISGSIPANTSTPWAIGNYSLGINAYFNGFIDELRVSIGTDRDYNTSTIYVPGVRFEDSFSNTNLLCHFDKQPNQDDSLKQLTMTNSNAVEYMPINPKFGTYSAYFDGTGSYLVGPNNNAAFKFSADFTVECWIYPFSSSTNTIFDTGVGTNATRLSLDLYSGKINVGGTGEGSILSGCGVVISNSWQHIAISRSGTTLNLFQNGTLIGTTTTSQNYSDGSLFIGQYYNSSYRFQGFIDEFRISNIARYTNNFTPASSAFSSDGNTNLLLHFEGGTSTITDSSSNNLTITNLHVGGLTPVYKFGTNACWFNGVDGRLDGVAGSNQYKFANDFTIEGWFLQTGWYSGPTQYFWSTNSGEPPSSTPGVNFTIAYPNMYVVINGSIVVNVNIANLYFFNIWNHLAVVRSGTTVSLYLNGVSIGSGTNSTNISDGYFRIGAGGTSSQKFQGYIDEFRISQSARYTGNFTPASSQFSPDANTYLLLHFDGNYTDSNTYNGSPLTITNTNTALITGPKFGTGCAYFNGTSSIITIPNNEIGALGSRNFVIEAWIWYITSATATFVFDNHGVQNSQGYGLYIISNVIHFCFNNGGWNDSGAGSVPNNTWTHIAIARSGNTIRSYINGTLGATITTGAGTIVYHSGNYSIGASYDSSQWFRGFIDELRISLDTDRGYTGSTITVPVAPFQDSANTYVNGPYYVSTTANSQINLTPYDTIAAATVSATEPNTTTLRFLVSFDNKSTWKTYSGGSWSTVTMTSANIISSGMNMSQLQTALPNWTTSLGSTLDIVAAFQTSNTSASPTLDNIQITASDYHMITPNVDYTVTKTRGGGARTLTFTRLKPGNANHEIDYF